MIHRTLSLGPLSLLASQNGLLLTITIHAPSDPAPVGRMTLTVPEWTALVALVDCMGVGEKEMARLRTEIRRLRHGAATQMAPSGGFVRCENPVCLASIDLPLIADSEWVPDARGWWFCPKHKERAA